MKNSGILKTNVKTNWMNECDSYITCNIAHADARICSQKGIHSNTTTDCVCVICSSHPDGDTCQTEWTKHLLITVAVS